MDHAASRPPSPGPHDRGAPLLVAHRRRAASSNHPHPTEPVALTVVVVFYNMAPGGPPHAPLAQPLVPARHRGPRLRGHRGRQRLRTRSSASTRRRGRAPTVPSSASSTSATSADPSPTVALNAGIAEARGEHLALMIDGAHVLTPACCTTACSRLTAYEPAVVATQQWYVGPGQQGETLQQRATTRTPRTGSSTASSGPPTATACSRSATSSASATGSTASSRATACSCPASCSSRSAASTTASPCPAAATPTSTCSSGSALAPGRRRRRASSARARFHQFHGGTTTNVADAADRRERVASYGEHFRELRGPRPPRPRSSRSSSSGRWTPRPPGAPARAGALAAFERLPRPGRPRHRAPRRMPVADELKLAAIEAVWDSQAWREATWLGHRVNRFPTDLHCYQELIVARSARRGRAWPATTTGSAGGRLFVASILDQLGHGRVVAVGRGDVGPTARTTRGSTHVAGAPEDPPRSRPRSPRSSGDEPAPWCSSASGGIDGWSRPSSTTPRWCRSVATSWSRTPWSTAARSARLRPGPHEAVVELLAPPPRLRARPRPRALHGDVQPERLPPSHGAAVTADHARSEPTRFFFVHLQKTAGTALFRRLRHHFGPDAVYPTPAYQGTLEATLDVDLLVERFAGPARPDPGGHRALPAVHHGAARRRLRPPSPSCGTRSSGRCRSCATSGRCRPQFAERHARGGLRRPAVPRRPAAEPHGEDAVAHRRRDDRRRPHPGRRRRGAPRAGADEPRRAHRRDGGAGALRRLLRRAVGTLRLGPGRAARRQPDHPGRGARSAAPADRRRQRDGCRALSVRCRHGACRPASRRT